MADGRSQNWISVGTNPNQMAPCVCPRRRAGGFFGAGVDSRTSAGVSASVTKGARSGVCKVAMTARRSALWAARSVRVATRKAQGCGCRLNRREGRL